MAEGRKASKSPAASAEDLASTPQREPLSPALKSDLQFVLQKHENELQKKRKSDDELEESREQESQTRKSEEEEEEEEKARKARIRAKMVRLGLRHDEEGEAKGDAKEESGNKEENGTEKENGEKKGNDVTSPPEDINTKEKTEKKSDSKESEKKKEKKKKKKSKAEKEEREKKKKDSKRKENKEEKEENKTKEKEGSSKNKSSGKKQRKNSEKEDIMTREGKEKELSDKTVRENVDSEGEKEKKKVSESSLSSSPLPLLPSGSQKREGSKEKEKENVEITLTKQKDSKDGKVMEHVGGNTAEEGNLRDKESKEQSNENTAKQTSLGDEKSEECESGNTAKKPDEKDEKQREKLCKSDAKEADFENKEMNERMSEITAKEASVETKEENRKNMEPVTEENTENGKGNSIDETTEDRIRTSEAGTEEGGGGGREEGGGGVDGNEGEEGDNSEIQEDEDETVEELPKKGERTTGYLNMKKKGAFKFWKRYYFVMEGQILKYYKSRQDYQNLKNFKGTLDVFAMESVKERRQGFLKHHHHPFDIQRRSKSTVHLAASTIEERDRWLALLQEALKKHKAPLRYSCTGISEEMARISSEKELRKYSTLPTQSGHGRRSSSSSTSSSDTDARNAQSEEVLDNRRSASRDSHIAIHPRLRYGVSLNVKLTDIESVKLKKARDSLSAKNTQADEHEERKVEEGDEEEEESGVERVRERFGVSLHSVKRDDPNKVRKISPTALPRPSREPVLPIQKNSLAAKHGDTSPRRSPTPVHKEVRNVPAIPLSKNMKQFVAKSQEDSDKESLEEMDGGGEETKDRTRDEDERRKEVEEEKREEEGRKEEMEQEEEREEEKESVTVTVRLYENKDDNTVGKKDLKVDNEEEKVTNDEEKGEEGDNPTHEPLGPKLSHASVKIIHYSETEDLMTDEVSQLDQISIVEAVTSENNEKSTSQEDSPSNTAKTTISSKSRDVVKLEDSKDKGKKEEPKQAESCDIPLATQKDSFSQSIMPTPIQDRSSVSPSSKKRNAKEPSASPKPSERSRNNTGSSTKSSSVSQRSDTDIESPFLRLLKGGKSGSVGEIQIKPKEDHSQARDRTSSDTSLVKKRRKSLLRIFKKEKNKPEKLSRLSATDESKVTMISEPEAEAPDMEQGKVTMKNKEPGDKTDLGVAEENESGNSKATKQEEDAILNEPVVKLRVQFENENLQVRSSYCSIYSQSSVEEDPRPSLPEKTRIREQSPNHDVPQNNRPVSRVLFQMMHTEEDPEEKGPVDGFISQEQIESILHSKEKRKKSVSQYSGAFLPIPTTEANKRCSTTSTISANSTSSDTERQPYLSSISTESDEPLPTTNFLGSNRSSVDSNILRENHSSLDNGIESDATVNETVTTTNLALNPKQASEATLGVALRKRSDTSNRSSFTASELVVVDEADEIDNDDSKPNGSDIDAAKTSDSKPSLPASQEEEQGEEEKNEEEQKDEEKEEEKEEKKEKQENKKKEEKEEVVEKEKDDEADELDYFPTLNLDEKFQPSSEKLQVPLQENTAGIRTSGIMALSKYLEQLKDNSEEEPTTNRGISRLGHSAAVEKLKEKLQDE